MDGMPARVVILQEAQALLRLARTRCLLAGAPRTVNKIRSSLKSVDGAIRHATRERHRVKRS